MNLQEFKNKWLVPCTTSVTVEESKKLYLMLKEDAGGIRSELFKLLHNYDMSNLYKTVYWRVICGAKRYQVGNKCTCCGKQGASKISLKKWEDKGNEFETLYNLECLCEDCYQEMMTNKGSIKNQVKNDSTPLDLINEFKELCNILAGGTINKSCINRLLKILLDDRTTDDFGNYVNEVYLYTRMVYMGKANGESAKEVLDNTRILKGTAAEYSTKFNENYHI